MDLVEPLVFAGTANAVLLSITTAFAIRRERAAAWLSATLAVLAAAMSAIYVTHRTEGFAESAAIAIEVVASLAAGPTLYHFIRASVGLPTPWRLALAHFMPALAGSLAGPWIALARIGPPPVVAMCAYQAAYTLLSAWTFLRESRRDDGVVRGFRLPVAALAAMLGIHGAQVARFWFGSRVENAVPVFAALAAFALVAIALVADRATQRAQRARYAKSGLDATHTRDIYERLVAALDGGRLHRRPELSLAELAAAAGVAAHHASQALGEAGATTFNDLLTRRRVDDARALLVDPANARAAVEPIGMEAGFRSRSTFYSAFRAATGVTPAEYRRRATSSMSAPSGPDAHTRSAMRGIA